MRITQQLSARLLFAINIHTALKQSSTKNCQLELNFQALIEINRHSIGNCVKEASIRIELTIYLPDTFSIVVGYRMGKLCAIEE